MAFSFPAFSYIIALIVDAFLIFFSIFHVIAFDELKTDYKNPIDQCNSLNPLVLWEYLLHLLVNILFLASGEWFSLLLNIPLIAYHIHRYRTRPVMSGPGLYDPTSIMNADTLTKCQREGWVKLAFYLLSFFYYLYGAFYYFFYISCQLSGLLAYLIRIHTQVHVEEFTKHVMFKSYFGERMIYVLISA